ncbi:MAG TPA: DUF4921 family protein, partial [Candidatus Acidoferrales bacterium]|nr:DUF4921 family protein [Candidatus Acidoferrales bacterium]
MVNELRRDYLLDRWVIIAPARAKRPSDYSVPRTSTNQPKACVFCPGNEAMTPPASLLLVRGNGGIVKLRDGSGPRRSDWLVRCVPNLFPAVSQPNGGLRPPHGSFPYVSRRAIGTHEIVIESPAHDDHPHRASEMQIRLWLEAVMDRAVQLSQQPGISAISIFRNHGREAGASIAHAHTQIIATEFVPNTLRDEALAMKRYHQKSGGCALCRVRAKESKSERKILDTNDYSIIAPWASVYPCEFWIIPKRHSERITDLHDEEVACLAKSIHLSFGALANTISDPPYNAVFHTAPTKARDKTFHWHLEVYPKLSIHAGFELGSGVYVNTMSPEAAAPALQASLKSDTTKN